jgi:peptide/nickel transport system permease protein
MLVKGTLDIGNAIILTAALSFIGLGAVPPEPEWGAMIAAGRAKFEYWWVATFPGLAILSVVLGFNFLGDGLQDWLNPRLRRD